jgi:hypothetical protein
MYTDYHAHANVYVLSCSCIQYTLVGKYTVVKYTVVVKYTDYHAHANVYALSCSCIHDI